MKTIKKLEKQPDEITEIYLNAVLMPNGEIICNGKSIWNKEIVEKYVYVAE